MRKRFPMRAIRASHQLILASSVLMQPIEAAEGTQARRGFRQVAYTGGPMRVPGYQHPVVLDFKGARLTNKKPILLEHDKKRIVAQAQEVSIVEGEGLVIAGFMLNTDDSQYVTSLADQGFEWQASVGASPLKPPRFVAAGQRQTINGQEIEGPFIHVTEWQLGEASFVAMGADSQTSSVVQPPIAASWLPAVPVGQAPRMHVARSYDHNEAAIECALLRSINCGSQTEKQFSDEINSAADTMAGITIHGAFARAIAAAGGSPCYEKTKIYTEAINTIRANNSTVSLPKVFANVLNKSLLAQMNLMPTVHRKLVKVDSATDFRSKSFIRLSGIGGFQRVNPEGELKSFKLVDAQYEAKLKTFGNILGLSREQMINDDIGAFAQLPEIFGRAAMIAAEQEFFTTLLGWINAGQTVDDFPTTGHPLDGVLTDLKLSLESLQWVLQKFRDQVDAQGSPMLTVPQTLLVSTANEIPALKLMTQIAATQVDNVNAMAGRFSVEVSPYLNPAVISTADARDYFLFANPSVLPAIIMMFLNGQQSPVFESSAMEFDIIGGMRWRGWWDFSFTGAERQACMMVDGSATDA